MTSEDLDALGIPWCYRQDSLQLAQRGAPFIINLDDKGSAGSHWVAACAKGPVLYYADPLGVLMNGYPPAELEAYKHRVVSRPTFQRPNTTLCGYYAICFVRAMRAMPTGTSQKGFEDRLASALST